MKSSSTSVPDGAAPAVASVDLRPASDADDAFLRSVYASTRADELGLLSWTASEQQAFVAMQYEAQTASYADQHPAADTAVVLIEGAPAGRMIVDRSGEPADPIALVDLALLPEFRGSGVGTQLLGDLLAEARSAGRRVRLHVEVTNPARRLYERLGFVELGGDGIYLLLECAPGDFESFRRLVLSDRSLQQPLVAVTEHREFVDVVVSEGARLGYRFGADDVLTAMQHGRREWIERGLG